MLVFNFYDHNLILLKKKTSEVLDGTRSKTNQQRVTLGYTDKQLGYTTYLKYPAICSILCLCIEYIHF